MATRQEILETFISAREKFEHLHPDAAFLITITMEACGCKYLDVVAALVDRGNEVIVAMAMRGKDYGK